MNELDRHDSIGCPDAEMLAAWSDGGLRSDERLRLEEHAATCARCQAQLAALARTAAVAGHDVAREKRVRLWPWLVPAAGAVAAVAVWVIVQPPPRTSEPEQPARQVQARDEADTPAAAPAAPPPVEEKRFESPQTSAPQANRALERSVDALAKRERSDRGAPPAAVSESAPMSATAAARAADATGVGNLVVRRSPEGQVTWEGHQGIYQQLIAGASPSPSVIWLVGKGGLILRSTDGGSWHRLPFPESIDLTGVDATSATSATVTSADARVFTTADGGATWHRK
jgi:hypothetical protein